jgi:hypothetical protein
MPKPASPLGDAIPVGAFWFSLWRCWQRKDRSYRRGRSDNEGFCTVGIAVHGTAKSMTCLAIAISHARQFAVGAICIVGTLMLVGMVTNMEAGGLVLVLAIRRRRSPNGLQRKKKQKEDGNPATHNLEV